MLSITVNTLVDELDGSINDGDISLRDALLAAAPFETINFDSSLTANGPATVNLKLGELRITKDVVINGPGSQLLTIDAIENDLTPFNPVGDGSRIFSVNKGSGFPSIEVRINGLTLTGGDAAGDGGAIRNFESLTTTDVVAAGNFSQRDGGGIFSVGSLTLINSTISGNYSTRDGGGVFSSAPYLTVHSSNITGNSAGGGGGGVINVAASNYLQISDSTISNNNSQAGGGGVLHANGIARITGSTINDNRSNHAGGGISTLSSMLTVIDSDFRYNRAYTSSGNGGGIAAQGGTANLLRTTIVGNSSQNGSGGGILSSSGNLSVTESEVRNNYVNYGGNGGGIASDVGSASISRTTIAGNSGGTGNGGGIWKRGGSLSVTESTLSDNRTQSSGGGIFSDGAVLSVQSSTISGNSARDDGGGLSIQSGVGQAASILNSTVAFNRARSYYYGLGAGGGIITGVSTVVNLDHTIVANNVRAGTADDILGRAAAWYSLIGVDSGLLLQDLGNNLIGTAGAHIDPLLAPLADNGGPTLTHSLISGSVAIDAGYTYFSGPQYDQRGASFYRVRNGDGLLGARVDLGAFEVAPGEIHGQKWHDLNGDGIKDPGEPGLAGWTIYIDENGNGEFDVETLTIPSTNVPQVAAPYSYGVSSVFVDGVGTVEDVNVTLNMSVPFISNLYNVYLISPGGAYVPLFYNIGSLGSNFTNTTFDDEATSSIISGTAPYTGHFRPEYPLSTFDGQNSNGNWTLQFYNNDGTNSATLNSWSLTFTSSERMTTTDGEGNYSFVELRPGNYRVGEVVQPNWEQTSEFPGELTQTLSNLNLNNRSISSLVPSRYNFSEGEFEYYISDGGDDMYDGGNILNTNLASYIYYSNGVVTPADFIFGPGSEYFTAKYQGLFVLAASNIAIDTFYLSGDLGADGGGSVDGTVLHTTFQGREYTIYVKRVYDAFDPSVNELIIVPGDGSGITHEFATYSNDNYHAIHGLSEINELYYALVARQSGQYLSNADVLNIANEFLANLGTSPLQTLRIESGDIFEGVDFGNRALPTSIRGRLWNDVNGDGSQIGEPGLDGWTVYLDENGNGAIDLDEPSTITDELGDYELTGAEAGHHIVTAVLPPGWMQTSPLSFNKLLEGLNENHAAITSLVPDLFNFLEGATGSSIDDGGSNMYDGGNILNTNLAAAIEYTDGSIMSTDAFGPGSSYFTAKYPGLFVMAAENVSIESFEINGHLGADGAGIVNSKELHTVVNGREYAVFFKRTHGAGTPSVIHIIIVPGDGVGISRFASPDSDEDLDALYGLSSAKSIYYLLVSRSNGRPLLRYDALYVADAFLASQGAGPLIVDVPYGLDVTDVDFGYRMVPAPALLGDYNEDGDVDSADYTVWRNSLGQTGITPFSGADGTGDGQVTMDDCYVWKEHYGETLAIVGTGSSDFVAFSGAGEEIVSLGAGEETFASEVAPQVSTELGTLTETAIEVGDAKASVLSSWFGVFAARDSVEGGPWMGRISCAEKPAFEAPARDQALLELFHAPVGSRRSADRPAQRFDVDSDAVDVLCDWLGERLAGKVGRGLRDGWM
jgi:subtilisin-like proprotein convertase family protein